MMQFTALASAISFAARAHEGQYRKDGETPYIAHPLRVMTVAAQLFGVTDVETLMAAVLHDTIEDTRTDHDELSAKFGTRVADYVAALTKDKRLPEETRERDYLDALAASPLNVQLCKLADVYDNLLDSFGMGQKERRKKIEKAREAVERFGPGFPDEWKHVLDFVNAAVRQAEGSPEING